MTTKPSDCVRSPLVKGTDAVSVINPPSKYNETFVTEKKGKIK